MSDAVRKAVEEIGAAFEHYAMGGSEKDYYNAHDAISRALAACDEASAELAALKAERDEELRGRLDAERRLDEVMNAKSALENVVCLENKWVAVEGGGYHRAVSSDKLGDLYDRLRRAEGSK